VKHPLFQQEVLIKFVAQSIPTYCMSSFLFPTSLGDEIQKMLDSFWWGSDRQSGKGINWMRWDRVAMRKEHGGMGFRHLYGFNLAMLGKQGWKLATDHDTIQGVISLMRNWAITQVLYGVVSMLHRWLLREAKMGTISVQPLN